MRSKKLFSIVLCLCMLVGLCQFSLVASAESVVTMDTTEFATGVQTINCTITSDSTDWWAAVYPASQTAYGGSNPVYADYIAYSDYKDATKTSFTFPSGDTDWRMKTWPLSDGEWKIVLFEHDNYTSAISECVFEVGVEGAVNPEAPTEYYVKKGATGDGLSAESPAGSIISIVNKINADGHDEEDLVTVYVIDSGEGKKEVIDSDCVLGYGNNNSNQVPEHKATIKWTSYNPDEVISIIGHINWQNGDSNAAHWTVAGPSIFEDINIVDMRNSKNGGTDIYLNHYPVEFHNVKFGDLRGVNETQYTTGTVFYPSSTHFAMGMIRGNKTVERDQYVYLDNADIIGDYVNITGYTDADKAQGVNGDVTLEIGAGTLKNLKICGTNAGATETIGGDLSIILGEGVTVKKIETGSIPVVTGTVNLIQNYGATIPAYTATPWATSAKDTKAPYYNLVAGAEGLAIDVTATAGEFAVDTAALAYAIAADGKTVYYGEGEIALEPGTWTVLPAASVDAIVEALEDPAVTVDKVFKGWDTSVDGIITAIIEDAPIEVDPIYYVKNGGTGDGLSAESPIGHVYDAVAAINAAGYDAEDEVTIFIMNGDAPEGATKEFYFYDVDGNDIQNANAGKNADAIYGRFTYWAPGGYAVPAHTATIVLKPYNTEVETFIAQHPVIGQNSGFTLGGPTVFEGLTILTNRMYDRELFVNGKDVTITDCLFKYQNCSHSNDNSKFTGISNGHERVQVGGAANNGNFAGSTVRIESPMTTNNTTYGLEISGTYSATYTGRVNVYIDHEDFAGTVIWGRGAGAFNNGLALVLNNGTVNNVDPGKGGNVTVTGGLQVVINEGASMNDLPANVTADKKWIVSTTGANLDVTDTAGTFAIEDGKYVYTVSEDKKTINYYTGTITLAEGTYALTGAESLEAIIEAAETPEIPEGYVFRGWDDSVAGVLTAKIVEKPTFTYYVQANATGNGLSAESPVATIKAAIDLINAAGATAEDDVTIYVLNGVAPEGATREFYFYDKDGNDIYNKSMKPVDGKYYYGRITAFMPDQGGTLPAHNCTINVKAYDTSVTTYLAYGEILGNNGNVCLAGDFIFDDITIVACRMYDREFFTGGRNVTFNNCGFAYENCGIYEGAGFTALVTGNERVMLDSVGAGTRPGGNVVINSVMTNQTDARYGLNISGTKGSTFQNEVNVTINHEDFKGQIAWGDAASTFSNGLNIVIENGNVKNTNKGKTITINGGFQVLVNDGGSMTEMVTNIAADKTWIVTAVGADLALTETDGTFAVPEGKVAYATDAEYAKEILYSVDGLLTLPEGTYTVKFADTLVDVKAAVTPFEDASMKFKGWIDDGAGKLTADYTLTGEAVVYYVQHGATGDGLSLENPGSFATVVEDINKKYGAGDEVTIKVVKAANEADTYTDLSTIALACIKDIPNHTAMLVIESADAENLSWLTTHQAYATSGYISTNVEITSPLTFKNIKIVDPRMDWYGDFYVNATNFTIGEGVTWYQPTYANNTLTLNGKARMSGIHGGSRSTKTFNTAFTVEFADGANLDQTSNGITLSGYNTSGTMTFNEEVNFKFGNSTVPKIIVDNMNGGGALFKKNVNIVLNGTTVGNLLSDGGKTTGTVINGALQIIKNNANVKVQTIADSLKANLYDLTVIGAAELDVTEIAGKYTVPAGVVAIAVDAEGNRYVSSNNILTVPAAGVYTVYTDYVYENGVYDFYNTVTLDVAELEAPEADGKFFLGWVYADGTAPKAEETEFNAGDKLCAKFIDFATENEEGTAGDFFIKGVQVRLEEPAGLRYIVEMDNEFYAALTQYSAELVEGEKPHFGTYVIPADLYDSADHAEVPAYKLYAEEEEVTQYTVCLINIKEGSYDRDFTVYGYIDYLDANGVIHTLTTKDYSTSIYDVAKVAVADGETAEFLTTIIESVEAE